MTAAGSRPSVTEIPDATGHGHRGATWAIAVLALLFVTGETLPVGLLEQVAAGVDTTPRQIGLAVGWYALVAGLAAVPLTRATARWDRRTVLLGCAGCYGMGHLLGAAATDLIPLFGARAVAAVAHGLFWAVAGPTVARLVPRSLKGRAPARVAVGGSAAVVVGTPLLTALGLAVGWRIAMVVLAATTFAVMVWLARTLPGMPSSHEQVGSETAGVVATLRTQGLPAIYAVTGLVVTAYFVLWTYISPYAVTVLHLPGSWLPALLLTIGAAGVAGNALAGRLVDLAPAAGVRAAATASLLAALGMVVAAWAHLVWVGVGFMLVWSSTFTVLAGSSALAVLRRAGSARAETATGIQGIVFQTGIMTGSALGSLCYGIGQLGALPLAAAMLAAPTVALVSRNGTAFGR